jgi:hypothetical protein
MTILLHGLKGEPVKRLQEKLGVKADVFGAETEGGQRLSAEEGAKGGRQGR